MAVKCRSSSFLSMGKQFAGCLVIAILFVALHSTESTDSIAQLLDDDNQTNHITSNESISIPDHESTVNSTAPTPSPVVPSHQMSSSSTPQPSSTSPKPSTTTVTVTSTTLPPPLPTPLPSKGHPKVYSGSPQSFYLAMDNLLQSKASSSYLGRTKRMKRSRPNMIKTESVSGNPFSLIKYLLANHLTSPTDYPKSYSLTDPKPGKFGPVYSSNIEDALDRNDFASGSMARSRANHEPSASFYPLAASDIEALELAEGDDAAFDSGFGGDEWNNQGTIDLINQIDADGSNGNNNIDLYPLDPFIPIRSFRSSSSSRSSHPGMLMRPIISMKRKRRPNGIERSPNPFIVGSSLFGDNRSRSRSSPNLNQYEQLINRINDYPSAYLP